MNPGMAKAVLISTYDLGHQPFGLASPAAWLKREGLDVECVDLARQKLDDRVVQDADLIAFHLPMHTATRLAAAVIRKSRRLNPSSRNLFGFSTIVELTCNEYPALTATPFPLAETY